MDKKEPPNSGGARITGSIRKNGEPNGNRTASGGAYIGGPALGRTTADASLPDATCTPGSRSSCRSWKEDVKSGRQRDTRVATSGDSIVARHAGASEAVRAIAATQAQRSRGTEPARSLRSGTRDRHRVAPIAAIPPAITPAASRCQQRDGRGGRRAPAGLSSTLGQRGTETELNA